MFIFGKDRINALNERIETLGQQSAKEADATRQALEGHTKALTERLSAIQEAENTHDMTIEDMLDSWQEFQTTLTAVADRMSDALSDQHKKELEEAGRRERRLLNLAMWCQDQLYALRRAAPAGAWERQLALADSQFAENALGCGLQVIDSAEQPFSPSLHEVLEIEETRDPGKSLQVAEVYTCGYIYAGKVIRKAGVKVWQIKENDQATEVYK